MKNNKENSITEQDIFYFVFYPEVLDDDKRQRISSDQTLSESISFYMKMKLDVETETDFETQKKLAEKISAYTLPNIIQLYQTNGIMQKKHGSRLAADSKELTPKLSTKTFVDNEKEYLIKVLNYGNHTKVFVFSSKDEVVKNFDIVIEPDELTFHLDDNSQPLIIDKDIEAAKIELRFAEE